MKVDFKGGKELEAALRELGNKAASKRVAARALDKAAQIIADRAIQLAPEFDGFLKKSIKVGARAATAQTKRFKRSESGGDRVERYVGIDERVRPARPPKTDRRRKRKEGGSSGGSVAFYAQVVEFGLADNPAQPFMRPAWEEKKMQAFSSIAGNLRDEIKATAERAARKSARMAG